MPTCDDIAAGRRALVYARSAATNLAGLTGLATVTAVVGIDRDDDADSLAPSKPGAAAILVAVLFLSLLFAAATPRGGAAAAEDEQTNRTGDAGADPA
jgi:hypothetical protein